MIHKLLKKIYIGFLVWYGSLSPCCHAEVKHDDWDSRMRSYCSACEKRLSNFDVRGF